MDEQKLHDILGQHLEVPDMVNKKLEQTYAQLENGHKQSRRMGARPLRTVLIVAALGAVCLLSIAAGLPGQMYNFLTGGSMTVWGGSSILGGGASIGGADMSMAGDSHGDPLVLENGRLWFVNGEERTDVTELIDENTPYIYEHTDPVSGSKNYVILGGTAEDFGWAEYICVDGGSGMKGHNMGQRYVVLNGERFQPSELTDEQWEEVHRLEKEAADAAGEGIDPPGLVSYETVYRPWMEAAMEQLGLQKF